MRHEALMTNRSEAARRKLAADIEAFTCGEVPSPLDMTRAAKLENWVTSVRRRGNEFVCVVVGDVCKHPEFGDGENIQTSAVAWFDRKDRFIRTHNRIYALGEPAPTRKE
jgi:hypothetical protein